MNFRILLVLSLIIFAFSACKKDDEKRQLLTERIEYDVTIDNEGAMEPWMNNVAAENRMNFLQFLFAELEAGHAVDSLGVSISEDDVKNMLAAIDSSLQFGNANLFEYVRNEYIQVQILRFREKWTYNPDNFTIYKQVQAVAPGIILLDSNGFILNILPLFWIPCDTADAKEFNSITELIISDALVQNNTEPVIQLYGESPYFLNNLDESLRDTFFVNLKNQVVTHKIKAYDYYFNDMDVAAVEDFRDHIDSIHVPDSTGKFIAYEYEVKILPKQFARLKFVEKWEYSSNPFIFKKTVMGINPSLYSENEFGEFEGYRPMFWIVFNDEYLQFIRKKIK